MWWRHFIYNASFTPLLKLMRFQIIQTEQHLNCYLVWKQALLEIREGDRYPLWREMPSVDSRSFGKAIRRNVVVKRTLDIWSPGEEAFTNLKVCDWWWGVWLQWGLLSEASDLRHTDKLGRQWKSWVDVTIWQLS